MTGVHSTMRCSGTRPWMTKIVGKKLCDRVGRIGLDEDEGTAVIGVRTAGDDCPAVDQFGEPCSMFGSVRVTACGGLG